MSNDVLRAGRSGVRIPAETRDVSLFQKSIPALGPTQHHIRWEPGSFQGDAVAVREVDYSSPNSAEASHKSNPPSVPRGIADSYSALPWVTWEAVTVVEDIP